jgi:TRAP transporter 4TM/12TM fusion protein
MKLLEWYRYALKENNLSGIRGNLAGILGIISSCVFIYTASFGNLAGLTQRGFMFLVTCSIVFLVKPVNGKNGNKDSKAALAVDLVLVAITVFVFGNVMVNWFDILNRAINVSPQDMAACVVVCLIVLEATRRVIGVTMPVITLVFIAYGFLGRYAPGVFQHRGISLRSFTAAVYTTQEGLYGTAATATANFIMIFLIFGAFLEFSGAGEMFSRTALSLLGGRRGGSAKASIVASALMGMISGSSVAVVAATGSFTIPLMKKYGYTDIEAGAINAVASTGGQIMPPVMGSAAFIMANTMGVPYQAIVIMALIPALLYYIAEFLMVDMIAGKRKIKGLSREEKPSFGKIMKKEGYMFAPVIALVVLLAVFKTSVQKAAFWSIVVTFLVSLPDKDHRITLKKFLAALINGAVGSISLGGIVGCAGIMLAIIMRSGLAQAFTGALVMLSGGHLIVLLLLSMVASLILGMGLPTTACYIIVATMAVPAIMNLGVAKEAAHLFAFYFGCISSITPPVAVAAFAAAGFSGCDPFKCGWRACVFGIVGFLVPYVFVYQNELLLMGTPLSIALVIAIALLGVYFLASGITGYAFAVYPRWMQAALIVASLMVIVPETVSTIIGLSVCAAFTLYNFAQGKKEKRLTA